jgi:hypothetical protein
MMEEVARGLMSDSIWGATARVAVGAAFAVADAVTDVVSIVAMHRLGLHDEANAMVAIVASAIAARLAAAALGSSFATKTTHDRVHDAVLEALFVVSLLKPVKDAYRAITSPEDDNKTWRIMDSILHMLFEGVPGVFLQASVIARHGYSTTLAVSIAGSFLSIAFTVASLNLELDIDGDRRRKEPQCYGMFKNSQGARTVTLLAIMGMTACMMAMKCAAIALLTATMPTFLYAYLAASQLIYFLVKLVRRQILTNQYSGPVSTGLVPVLLTFIWTVVIIKALVDFLLMPESRKPFYTGGVHWMWQFFENLLFVFGAAYVYTSSDLSGTTTLVLSPFEVWTFFTVTALTTIGFFSLFLASLHGGWKGSFAMSFFSTQNASQYVCDSWRRSDDDYQKMIVFDFYPILWKDIESEVKMWVAQNWGLWVEAKPPWFEKVYIHMVPDEMIPPEFLQKLKVSGNARRRKSSVLGFQFEDKNATIEGEG